jgi:hypothetical protein
MAARTAWTAGNGQGLTWGTLINSVDMTAGPLATANTVLSSVAGIANGTSLDMFMDISAECLIASSTVVVGANLAFWFYDLQEDGSTYGDGKLTAGTGAAITPVWPPCAVIPLYAAVTQTTLIGIAKGIVMPVGTFAVAIQNNSGFTLTSGTQTVKYRTYNINLNN